VDAEGDSGLPALRPGQRYHATAQKYRDGATSFAKQRGLSVFGERALSHSALRSLHRVPEDAWT